MKHTKRSVAKNVDRSLLNCDFCSRPYKTEKGLENHIETEHAEED